jgi:hypothetical protein
MNNTTKKRGLTDTTNAPVPSEAAPPAEANKKPRKKPVTAKSLSLMKEEFDRIKPAPIKKKLKEIVKTLAKQVDADWHDGWDDQAVTKGEWFMALEEPLQAVLDIGVAKETALLQCNEVLKIVSDSYYDLLACPCRCDTKEDLGDMDKEFGLDLPWGDTFTDESGRHVDAWSYVWIALLRVHANSSIVDSGLLLQCIKDASDNMQGAETLRIPEDMALYNQSDEEYDITFGNKDGQNVPDGTNLAQIVRERASEWKSLPSTKKVHRMRRAIDRRFDGTPERRTRDYRMYDEYGDSDEDSYGSYGGMGGRGRRDCVIM